MPDQPLTLAHLSELLDGESLEVIRARSPNEPMYDYNPDLYFVAGREALRCCQLALLAARRETVESILDFACAKGRVLRYFKAAFPDATLTACDMWEEGVDFCSRTFGAKGVISKLDPGEVELEGLFDLIWCSSLLTHVDRDRWTGFVELFESVLAPGGVAVFTVYGRSVAKSLQTGKLELNLNPAQIADVLRDYEATGFGFAAASSEPRSWRAPGMGDCVASPAWVCTQLERLPSLEHLLYIERGWVGQDVVACRRAG